MASFFQGIINPDFSANDFKKRSMQKSQTIKQEMPVQRSSLFEGAGVLRKSISYTSKENADPNEAGSYGCDPFRPSFIVQSAQKRASLVA